MSRSDFTIHDIAQEGTGKHQAVLRYHGRKHGNTGARSVRRKEGDTGELVNQVHCELEMEPS